MARDPTAYGQLGISANKQEVHDAVAACDPGLYPGAFCRIAPDVLAHDPAFCCAAHSDGAGTKTLVAYLRFRESGDPSVFRSLAQDALVMNLDDLACVGATDTFLLTNVVGRNSFRIPGSALREIIAGYEECRLRWAEHGITLVPTGGETADLVDLLRTLVVDATLTTRWPRADVVDNANIRPNDAIIGLSSLGQTIYEDSPNSGIGANGLTLARHALLCKHYAQQYPEALAPEVDPDITYRGPFRLGDRPEGLDMSIGEALASPTRAYAPILRAVLRESGTNVHGIIHNTGGGQTKCLRFGQGLSYIKDQLFPCPPLFQLIAEHGKIPWREMYQTFNMGHRMEIMVAPKAADDIISICQRFGASAQVVGVCVRSSRPSVEIHGVAGVYTYGLTN